jgi:hypothetical protein
MLWREMTALGRVRGIAAAIVVAATGLALAGARQPAHPPFAQTIASLSERGGYFDTDNLISNESSYLQVLPALRRGNVLGGAYIGVGPDQNFTYIAETRPAIAFIVDIRRDNLLLHLLFKALFQRSRTRVEYLALLFGRPVPDDIDPWRAAGVDRLVRYIDDRRAGDVTALRTRVEQTIREFGVPLSADDIRTIAGFHQRFIDAGLSLQFQSAGRPPQGNYPTYRDLIVDTDGSGRHANFVASEDSFQFVRGLELHDRVIPVVGDLSGPSAIVAVGKLLATRGERVSAFYASNVEFYLFREGSFPRFVENLRQVPHAPGAVIIRSIFGRYGFVPARPGDVSVSQLQPIDDLLGAHAAGRIRSYADLIAPR